MTNNSTKHELTQARIEQHIDMLFEIAFELGCEVEQLRHTAEDTGARADKLAYIAASHALRQAVDEHREANTMYRYWLRTC